MCIRDRRERERERRIIKKEYKLVTKKIKNIKDKPLVKLKKLILLTIIDFVITVIVLISLAFAQKMFAHKTQL